MINNKYGTFRIRKNTLDKLKEEKEKGDLPFTSISGFIDHLLREYLRNKEGS